MKNIAKTVALITLFTIFTRLSGFIFRIFMSRVIGAEALGLYQIAFSVFASLVTICCSGIPLCTSRLCAKYSELGQNESKFKVTTSALIVAFLSAIFLCLVIILFKNLLSNLFTNSSCFLILLTLLPAVVFSSVHGVIRGYLWGEDDYLSVCVIELVEQYIRIIACTIALSFAYTTLQGALSASTSLTIAIALSCLLILIVYRKKGGKFCFSKASFKEVIKASAPVTGLRFATSLMQPLISLIIPFCLVKVGYTSEQAISLFGLSMGMAFPLLFLPTTIIDSLSITLISSLSRLKANGGKDAIALKITKSCNFASFVACLCLPIFLTLGGGVCEFLFNSAFAGDFLSKASFAIIPFSLSGITTSILNTLEQEKQTFLYYIYASVVMVVLLFVLPYFIGIYAITVAFFTQNTIICLLNFTLLKKLGYNTQSCFVLLVKLLLTALTCSVLTYFLFNTLSMFLPLVINLIICGSICVLCFMLLAQTLHLYNVKEFILRFIKKSKKTA